MAQNQMADFWQKNEVILREQNSDFFFFFFERDLVPKRELRRFEVSWDSLKEK